MNALRLLAAACLALAVAPALSQGFPNKAVHVIVPFTPGSASDVVGRAVSETLAELWGQPVIVENRPGAGGSIGSLAVVRAAPDGYTLLANSRAHAANPAIYAKLPYDTLKDFTNLSPLAGQANVLIVGPQTGFRSLGQFIAAAKAKPGALNFSSAGIGSGTHLNLEQFKLMAGVDVTHVPYKGTPEAIADTIAGRVCCYFSPLASGLPHIKSGRAIALGVSSAKRSPLLPEVPTIAEAGVPGFEYSLWVGLWGPAGMAPALAEQINRDVNRALATPTLRERLAKIAGEPMHMTLAEFSEFMRREVELSHRIIKAAGIKPI
jgi:tripartite-type tricarboxylate transporter receptor subunit TctC